MKNGLLIRNENLASVYALILNALRDRNLLITREAYTKSINNAQRLIHKYAGKTQWIYDDNLSPIVSSQGTLEAKAIFYQDEKFKGIFLESVGFTGRWVFIHIGDRVFINTQGIFCIRGKNISGVPRIVAMLFVHSLKEAEKPIVQKLTNGVYITGKVKVSIPHPDPCFAITTRSKKNPQALGRNDGAMYIFSKKGNAQTYKKYLGTKLKDIDSFIISEFTWDELVNTFTREKSIFNKAVLDMTDKPGFYTEIPLGKDI